MSGPMVTLSASVVLQVRVADSFCMMVTGSADMCTVGSGYCIVTVTLAVAVPPAPVAVMVQMVDR